MIEIWYVDGMPRKVNIAGKKAAQAVWDGLNSAKFKMLGPRPA